ncbi:hypothetical protein [Salmon gill poxvirus]|nr:hypothetical protein [Salmon gill poxvirus]
MAESLNHESSQYLMNRIDAFKRIFASTSTSVIDMTATSVKNIMSTAHFFADGLAYVYENTCRSIDITNGKADPADFPSSRDESPMPPRQARMQQFLSKFLNDYSVPLSGLVLLSAYYVLTTTQENFHEQTSLRARASARAAESDPEGDGEAEVLAEPEEYVPTESVQTEDCPCCTP